MKMDPSKPLIGQRVLDLGTTFASRFCARLLADAGADTVRRLQRLRGVPRLEKAVLHYLDRGKSIVSLGRDVGRLLLLADIVVIDSNSGVQAEQLHNDRPNLIVVSITPFGRTGPRANWKGDDLIAVAAGGLAHASPGIPDYAHDLEREFPLRPDALIGELVAGLHGAIGAMFANIGRDKCGTGDVVDISMQHSVAALMPWDVTMWTYGGNIVGRRQVRIHLAPNAYLPSSDGWVMLVAFAENHWRALVELMGSPDWADNELFASGIARGENWDALEPLMIDWLQTQDRWSYLHSLQGSGLPCAPALELPDALQNEQTLHRCFLTRERIEGVGETLQPGDVFFFSGARRALPAPAAKVSFKEILRRWSSEHHSGPVSSQPPEARPPLEGIRIVDFCQYIAMPLAAQWLALMGAEVILVESAVHLHSRLLAPFAGERGLNRSGEFNSLAIGKRSVTLNLQTAEGLNLAKRLIQSSQMVLENFSPGTMEKLGLSYEELCKLRPDIMMISLSAFGNSGPWRNYAAFHSGIMALSGLASVTGYEGGYPRLAGAAVPDTITAGFCLLAALQAIQHWRRTGDGQHVEVAMCEAIQSIMIEPIAEFGLVGEARGRMGNRHRTKAPHGVYRCKGDDAWVAISVGSEPEWRGLCAALGRNDLIDREEFRTAARRKKNEAVLDALVAGWALSREDKEAAEALQQAGVPATPVVNARDLLEDAQLMHNGAVVEVDHPEVGPRPIIGLPWRPGGTLSAPYRHAPLFGEDNDYVLGTLLGLSAGEIARLREEKVIY